MSAFPSLSQKTSRVPNRLASEVARPGQPRFDEARRAFNPAADQHPAAVVLAESALRPDTNPGRHETLTATQPAVARPSVNGAWCEALFASPLQPSDSPTAGMAAQAANWTLRQFGVRGCAGRMAQEFGDHPDAAASRMHWVRQLPQTGEGGR
jgi:hypothetical protein